MQKMKVSEIFSRFFRYDITLYVLFCMLTWIAYYLKMNQFGLYEDDYWFVGIPATMSFQEMLIFLKEALMDLERGQGRFVGSVVPGLLAFLTFHSGGLWLSYFFGVLLVGLNGFLVYRIANKCFPSNKYVGIVAAIVFILFPADTTKALLVHIYQLQLSMFFILVAFNFYLSNRKFWAYLFALFTLLTYESPFLPFIFAPLLVDFNWNKYTFFRFIKHNFILFGFVVFMFVFRKLTGEERVAELEMGEFLIKTTASFLIGPSFSIFSFLNAMYESIINITITFTSILLSFIVILFIISAAKTTSYDNSVKLYHGKLRGFSLQINITKELDNTIKLLIASILMLSIAYSFSITHFPPTALAGRKTSVHLAATIGISFFVSSVINLILYWINNWKYKKVIYAAFILLFSIIAGYGSIIQQDFVKSWQKQKSFWSQVVEIAPDLNEDTHIMVKADSLPETHFVYSYSWALPMVLNQIYDFPESWDNFPKVSVIDLNMEQSLTVSDEGDLFFKPTYPFLYNFEEEVYLPQKNVIWLELDHDEQLKRKTGLVSFDTTALKLKSEIDKKISFSKTKLYNYIIKDQ